MKKVFYQTSKQTLTHIKRHNTGAALLSWLNSQNPSINTEKNPIPAGYAQRSRLLVNHYGLVIVPQGEQFVHERLGKFVKLLPPGWHFLWPVIDSVAYRHITKEVAIPINAQTGITKDNVQLKMDGVVYLRVVDVEKASYEVEEPYAAIVKLAQTTMRAEIGRMALDETFRERKRLNERIVQRLEPVAMEWGLKLNRYEISDIIVPEQIKIAMELEAEAERKKRKTILDSEAERKKQENEALGRKNAQILVSEAEMTEEKNLAIGEAFAIREKAKASAEAIAQISQVINERNGQDAVSYKIALEYIEAFGNIAKKGNTMIVPANASDTSSMIAQAVSIYDQIKQKPQRKNEKIPPLKIDPSALNPTPKDTL